MYIYIVIQFCNVDDDDDDDDEDAFFCFQIHPLSICSNELSTEQFPYGWVGVMRLEQINTPCMSLFQQVKRLFLSF